MDKEMAMIFIGFTLMMMTFGVLVYLADRDELKSCVKYSGNIEQCLEILNGPKQTGIHTSNE